MCTVLLLCDVNEAKLFHRSLLELAQSTESLHDMAERMAVRGCSFALV